MQLFYNIYIAFINIVGIIIGYLLIKFQSLNIKTQFWIFRYFKKLFIYTNISLFIFEKTPLASYIS